MVSKSRLKAHMLELFREIEKDGSELIVTDNNRPVLRILPIRKKVLVEELFGGYQGRVSYYEDPNKTTAEEWSEA
jgi:antitoxin (DNA-binding transcriptional repressor) of toxin-antitoxin stability system